MVEFVVDSIRGKKYKFYSIRCTNIDAQHFNKQIQRSTNWRTLTEELQLKTGYKQI